jgi:hypothetical protein
MRKGGVQRRLCFQKRMVSGEHNRSSGRGEGGRRRKEGRGERIYEYKRKKGREEVRMG